MKCDFLTGARLCISCYTRSLFLHLFNLFAVGYSYPPFNFIARSCLTLTGASIDLPCQIGEHLFVLFGKNVTVDKNCRIGTHCRIYDFCTIHIGKNLLASHGLTLISGTHDPISYENRSGPISIGANVWIGINVTIVGPVAVGNNVVIGAGSLVIRDIPDNAIVAGNPAKLLRMKT